jgi:hypothetical protein
MGMFIDLIYKIILPVAKREGVDPESVVSAIKNHQQAIVNADKELRKMFDDGEMKTRDGRILKYSDVYKD